MKKIPSFWFIITLSFIFFFSLIYPFIGDKKGCGSFAVSTLCEIRNLTMMIEMYSVVTGKIPTENDIWNELISSKVISSHFIPLSEWEGYNSAAKFKNGVVYDHWGNPFIYKANDKMQTYKFYSIGPNGIDESCDGDDIKLWDYQLEDLHSCAKTIAEEGGLILKSVEDLPQGTKGDK